MNTCSMLMFDSGPPMEIRWYEAIHRAGFSVEARRTFPEIDSLIPTGIYPG